MLRVAPSPSKDRPYRPVLAVMPPQNESINNRERNTGSLVRPAKQALTSRVGTNSSNAAPPLNPNTNGRGSASRPDYLQRSDNDAAAHVLSSQEMEDMAYRWWRDHLQPKSSSQLARARGGGRGKVSEEHVGWLGFSPPSRYCENNGFIPSQYILSHEKEPARKQTVNRKIVHRVLKYGKRGEHYAIGWKDLYHLVKKYGETAPDNHMVRPGIPNHEIVLSYSGPPLLSEVLSGDTEGISEGRPQAQDTTRKENAPLPKKLGYPKDSDLRKRKRTPFEETSSEDIASRSYQANNVQTKKKKQKKKRIQNSFDDVHPPGDPLACDNEALCNAALWGHQRVIRQDFREWYDKCGLNLM